MRLPLVLALVGALAGCASVSSSALSSGTGAPPWTGAMFLSITQPPPAGAIEVGVAEASGPTTIDELVPELMQRSRDLGGNYVLVQSIQTRFEVITLTRLETYNCGTVQTPQTCTRTVTTTEELPVTQMIARAFRVEQMR